MSRWGLLEYEHNGYDDSDWYLVYFDDETGQLGTEGTATTRGGGPSKEYLDKWHAEHPNVEGFGSKINQPPDAILERAQLLAADQAIFWAVEHAKRQQLNPSGSELARETGRTVYMRRTVRKRKPQLTLEAGATVDLLRVIPNQFQTVYRNGYNRQEYRALVRLLDGTEVWIDAGALALQPSTWTLPESTREEITRKAHAHWSQQKAGSWAWHSLTGAAIAAQIKLCTGRR